MQKTFQIGDLVYCDHFTNGKDYVGVVISHHYAPYYTSRYKYEVRLFGELEMSMHEHEFFLEEEMSLVSP